MYNSDFIIIVIIHTIINHHENTKVFLNTSASSEFPNDFTDTNIIVIPINMEKIYSANKFDN